MALSPLTSSDVGAGARDKINAGLTATDANTAAIATEATARNSADGALGTRIDDANDALNAYSTSVTSKFAEVYSSLDRAATKDDLASEATTRSTADGALGTRVDEAFDALNAFAQTTGERLASIFNALDNAATKDALTAALATALRSTLTGVFQAGRPGLGPEAFTASATGSLAGSAPLDPAGVVATPFGPAYQIAGAGLIAPRAPVILDPDAITVLRVRYSRITDVLDPNNNAIDIGLQWLDQAGADAGTTLLFRDPTLRVQDGQKALTFRVPSLRDARPAITPPATAASWRPFVRTYGADGATAVAMLDTRDATFAGVYAPDVSDLANRLGQIEGVLNAGLPLTTPILPSYFVADLVAGRPAPARGKQAWAQDGRARNADGSLEAANAGTGVEVQGNGSKWVYPGTNQQVQA